MDDKLVYVSVCSRNTKCEAPDCKQECEHVLTHNVPGNQVTECIVLTNYGMDNVAIEYLPIQPVGSYDVLIDVYYFGINFCDIYTIQGVYIKSDFPAILGLECSGTVLYTGKNVNKIKVGDTVAVFCPKGGAFRRKLVINEKYVFSFPNCHSQLVAAVASNFATAFEIYNNMKHIPYNSILFHGCSGGVGLALSNLLKNKCKKYGTCSDYKLHCNNDKLQQSYQCISYNNWESFIRKINLNGIDCIIDTIGGKNVAKCIDALSENGTLVILGATSGLDPLTANDLKCGSAIELLPVVLKNLKVIGVNLSTAMEQRPDYIRDLMNSIWKGLLLGEIEPSIFRIYNLSEIRLAFEQLYSRRNIGKVLVQVTGDLPINL